MLAVAAQNMKNALLVARAFKLLERVCKPAKMAIEEKKALLGFCALDPLQTTYAWKKQNPVLENTGFVINLIRQFPGGSFTVIRVRITGVTCDAPLRGPSGRWPAWRWWWVPVLPTPR